MPFDVQKTNQVELIEYALKGNVYKVVARAAKSQGGRGWVQASGLFVGATCAFLTVSRRVSQVAENFFKGLINLAGAPFSPRYDYKKGLNQLLWQTSKNLLILPFSAIHGIYDIGRTTLNMFSSPISYSDNQWCYYDINEYERRVKLRRAEQEAEQRAENERLRKEAKTFNKQLALLETATGDTLFTALNYVRWAYENGRGTEQNFALALKCIERAGALGDVPSMLEAARWYEEGRKISQQREKAYKWYKKAAAKGSLKAMTKIKNELSGYQIDDILNNIPTFKSFRKPFDYVRTFIDRDFKTTVKLCRKYCVLDFNKEEALPYLTALLLRFPEYEKEPGEQKKWQAEMEALSLSNEEIFSRMDQLDKLTALERDKGLVD